MSGTLSSSASELCTTSERNAAQRRRDLGIQNSREMFVQDIESFLDSYGPTFVDVNMANECLQNLAQSPARTRVVHKRPSGKYIWKNFKTLPCSNLAKMTISFEPLKAIVDAVLTQTRNGLQFTFAPGSLFVGDTSGGNCKMDACFAQEPDNGQLQNIISPWVFTTGRDRSTRGDVHLNILGACHHIFNEDPRRMWMFAMTFENAFASIWYFSRTHSVKSLAFNWIKNPNLLVRVLLGFATATFKQLGIEPTIHIGPSSPDGSLTYVYEAPPKPEDTNPRIRYYKTVSSLANTRPICLAGRNTRVWEVIEVTSPAADVVVAPGKPAVLKDVWLDKDIPTEAANMDTIFIAVDAFVEAGLAKARHENLNTEREELMTWFIAHEKCFKGFDDGAKKRLAVNLTGQHYRSLFLTKIHDWTGEKSMPLGKDVKRCPDLFRRMAEEEDGNVTGSTMRREESNPTIQTIKDDKESSVQNPEGTNDTRRFIQKQQTRFLYEEVCTTLQNLPTLKDIVDVLCQTVDVLHILLAVGWVHRDISANNIMAVCNNGRWTVKLADLEFSRLVVDKERVTRADPRTGTPFFMPVEILSRKYFYTPYVRKVSKDVNLATLLLKKDVNHPGYSHLSKFRVVPFHFLEVPDDVDWPQELAEESVVNHNYQHDLESVWWILLWIMTSRISFAAPIKLASKLFSHNVESYGYRESLIKTPLEIPGIDSRLTDVLETTMELLREKMYLEYVMRPIFGSLEPRECYAAIHATFATQLRALQATVGPWQTMPIQRSLRNTAPRAIDIPTTNAGSKRAFEDTDNQTLNKRPKL